MYHFRKKDIVMNKWDRLRLWIQILVCFVLLTASGCTHYLGSNDFEAFIKPSETDVTMDQYILLPPDEIQILCNRVPELHEQTQQIRPDGKVSFEAIGEIHASGLTPAQIAKQLEQKVSDLYTLPGENPIDVRVTVFRSHLYYVLGQVFQPGPKIYTGRDTLLQAITSAQINPMAWEQRIQVIRPSDDPSIPPKSFETNLNRMIIHGDTSQNILLQEGDIIYVPPTPFAAAGLFLEEIIRPVARAFSGAYILTSGAQGVSGTASGARF